VPAFSPAFLVNHPALIGRVLHENPTNYRKGPAAARVRPLFGDGLTTADSETWQEHRRLLQPLFQSERVHAFSRIVAEVAADAADRWRDLAQARRPVDNGAEMLALTRQVILRVLFGDIDPAQAGLLGSAMDGALREINRHVWSALPAPLWLPTPGNRALAHALQTLHGFITAGIADVRPPRRDPASLLDFMLDLPEDRMRNNG
jgi:cytochrome P450